MTGENKKTLQQFIRDLNWKVELYKNKKFKKPTSLEDTIADMMSDDPFERMVAERNQLLIRIKNIERILSDFDEVDYPTFVLMDKQYTAMTDYLDCLELGMWHMIRNDF